MKAWLPALALVTLTASTHAEVNPRRASLECDGQHMAAILIAPDTAWTDARCNGKPTQVCSIDGSCAAVLGAMGCRLTKLPCPDHGTRIVLSRALTNVTEWPSDVDESEALIDALRRDPEIAALFHDHYRHASPRITWGVPEGDPSLEHRFGVWGYELSASAGALQRHRDSPALGTEVGFAGVWAGHGELPGAWASGISHGFHVRAGVYSPETRVIVFAGIDAYNLVGPFDASSMRVPSLLGVILPEAGYCLTPARSFVLRWTAPFSMLLTQYLALDIRTSVGILYTTPDGSPDWFVGLTLGPLLRITQ
jgi:hypothetical protein